MSPKYERMSYDCSVCGRTHHRFRSQEGELHRAQELGLAWAEAETALPEGLVINSLYREELGCQGDGTCPYGEWRVYADRGRHDDDPFIGLGPTPAAALRALAATCSERKGFSSPERNGS
jgi:hypothetical protein